MFGLPSRAPPQSSGYSGSDSYKFIDRLINGNSSALRVVTPFLGTGYARMLQRAAKRKRVYVLVSSGRSKETDEAARILEGAEKKISIKLIFAVSAVFLGLLALRLYLYSGMAAVSLLLISAIWLRKPKTNLRLKRANGQFIHEKLYISDSEAIVGSANLTYSGTHRNIEHIEIIRDQDRVDQLSEHFEDIWSRY